MTTEGSAITDELRSLIGITEEPAVMEVERGAIKRFCQAVDDTNPLFNDAEYAKNGPYGDVICPPGFFGWPAKAGPMFGGLAATLMGSFAKTGFPGVLDGGMEYEFYLPIHPGDVLVSAPRVADIYEREGKAGKSLFGVVETTYTNQNGAVVAKARGTFIGRPA
jgi:acyl dehydratase